MATLAVTGLASAALVGTSVTPFNPAGANPAPDPTTVSRTAPGALSGVVPDGACGVRVTVRGGAGGSVISGVAESNGGGAVISATYPVVPGQPYSGYVGGGGMPSTGSGGLSGNGGPNPGVGGVGDGGTGGNGGTVGSGATHAGAGGGGRSSLTIAGTELIIAGGGGGSGGGHATDGGFGGNAGLPGSFDTVANGSSGVDGPDRPDGEPLLGYAGGGKGGSSSGGAGGASTVNAALNGSAGSGGNGGQGGTDPNYDSGGGGGGGVGGGGGGASTSDAGNGPAVAGSNSGGGGGGGSSRASSSTPGGLPGSGTDLASSVGPRVSSSHDGKGADGLIELDWIPCEYDLGITKTSGWASSGVAQWTLTVTNHGPDAMTRGDVVTITDNLPDIGEATVTGLNLPSGVTCDVTISGAMASPVNCSRPFDESAHQGYSTGSRGLDVGESITITYQKAISGAVDINNRATVSDRSNPDNNTSDASLAASPPVAGPRTSHGPKGQVQNQDPDVTAGSSPLVPSTLTLLDGPGGTPVSSVVVAGQGTYTVAAGKLVFTPEPDFVGTADPVWYRMSDEAGNHASSTYTPTVIAANPDFTSGPKGATQTIDPLLNDQFAPGIPADPATLVLLDGATPVTSLVVPGVGSYEVVGGVINFMPEDDFTGSHTVPYRITDTAGVSVESTYTPTVPAALPDYTSGPQGYPQSTDALDNDLFSPGIPGDPTTLTLIDPDSGDPVATIVVPGQGTYSIDSSDPANPRIVFTPLPSFVGTATPADYRVLDQSGVPVESTYTPTLWPVAFPDVTSGYVGEIQTIDPLLNDDPDGDYGLDPTTLKLIDPVTGDPTDHVEVPGVGHFFVIAGVIRFQPDPNFTGEAPPIGYQVDTADGVTIASTYTPTVIPLPVPPVRPEVNPGDPSNPGTGPSGPGTPTTPTTPNPGPDPSTPTTPSNPNPGTPGPGQPNGNSPASTTPTGPLPRTGPAGLVALLAAGFALVIAGRVLQSRGAALGARNGSN